MMQQLHVGVVGAATADADTERMVAEVGRGVASRGTVLVCGGLGGVMAAACRGAKEAGGTTIGILPGSDRSAANQWVDVAIATGMGEMRNVLVVRTADAVIAVDGGYGTLSEVALALKTGTPVVGLDTWELARGGMVDEGVVVVDGASEAVDTALRLAGPGGDDRDRDSSGG